MGRWNSAPPWIHGGNLDNKELVEGSSLFIPIHVKGALFGIGVEEKKMKQTDAYMLCSVAVDVDITQLVDGNVGVHAMLPKSIFVK